MPGQLENPKVNIVLLGTFDPAAAVPDKLGEAGVIRADEAVAARFKTLVPGQIAEYALEWCNVSVVRERFSIETWEPPFVRICDFVQKTINELMPHAIIERMGVNRTYTIKFSSTAERDLFGIRLVPPNGWGAWGRQIHETIAANPSKPHGGMMNVIMREVPIADHEGGRRDVQVAPDPTSIGPSLVALMTLNEHFEATSVSQPTALEPQEKAQRLTSSLLDTLARQFDNSVNALEAIARDILHG